MKSIVKPLAAAISLALASAAAHAQLAPPSMGASAPASQSQLILAIWDNNSPVSEVVSLNYSYADLTAANLNVNSATSPFTTAVNPLTGSGSVYQLNFGIVPQFASTFSNISGNATQYLVASANGTYADVTGSTQQPITAAYLTDINNAVTGELANMLSSPSTPVNTGYYIDPTGAQTYSVNSATSLMQSGNLGTVTSQFGGSVGTALGFYNVVTPSSRGSQLPAPQTQFGNANGTGFWYLSTSGQLSYNVPAGAVSAVPLPAAFWLLASGVAGLGTIGRRRRLVVA